jgi:DNA topoisomerase IA
LPAKSKGGIAGTNTEFSFCHYQCNQERRKEAPPRLFDLTSLQVECNKKFAYSADETLKIIQSLYEKKVATYPRVDTTYLSDDIYPNVRDSERTA